MHDRFRSEDRLDYQECGDTGLQRTCLDMEPESYYCYNSYDRQSPVNILFYWMVGLMYISVYHFFYSYIANFSLIYLIELCKPSLFLLDFNFPTIHQGYPLSSLAFFVESIDLSSSYQLPNSFFGLPVGNGGILLHGCSFQQQTVVPGIHKPSVC